MIDDDVAPMARSLYMLPIGNRWNNKKGVTLIGDAAHLMTPFAGVGVNLAMEDAMLLAAAITKAESSKDVDALTTEVKLFEENMFKRAKNMQAVTYGNVEDMFFTEGAPRTVIERWIVRAVTNEMGAITSALVSALVYSFYFFYKLIY